MVTIRLLQLGLSNTFICLYKILFKSLESNLLKWELFFFPSLRFPAQMVRSPENLRDWLCPRVHSLLFMLLSHQVGVVYLPCPLVAVSEECPPSSLGAKGRGGHDHHPPLHLFTHKEMVMPGLPKQLVPAFTMYPSQQIFKDHKLFATNCFHRDRI